MSPLLLLITTLIGGASSLLQAEKNKSLATAGVDIELADEIAVAVLQATAQAKNAIVDWTNADAVAGYIKSLPAFTPIPEPTAAPVLDPPAS